MTLCGHLSRSTSRLPKDILILPSTTTPVWPCTFSEDARQAPRPSMTSGSLTSPRGHGQNPWQREHTQAPRYEFSPTQLSQTLLFKIKFSQNLLFKINFPTIIIIQLIFIGLFSADFGRTEKATPSVWRLDSPKFVSSSSILEIIQRTSTNTISNRKDGPTFCQVRP